MHRIAILLVLAAGCARERAPSPVELDDLSGALFRDWEDPATLQRHVGVLSGWLDDEGRSVVAWDGMRLSNLEESEVATVDYPDDTDLSAHGGMATAMGSAFPIEAHAALLVEADQTFTDPGSFVTYERTVLGGDAAAFVAGDGLVRTENTITKRGAFGIEIPYTLRKDYRWATLGDRSAIVGRTWVTEPGCSENGKNCVLQSWGVDAFVADGDETLRLYEVWIEVETEADGLISEEQKLALVARGNQDVLEATEEALGAL
ncbi:MAG: hypothetical protein H6737_15000 [Alphaproteobacteria bacterium]|nr:hypothetical protein [Alphaproteobacteria bacterium]